MRYFGTDGIRDLAGEGRLAPEVVERVGRSLARLGSGVVVLGRDPRPSGEALTHALAAALVRGGAQVEDLGVVPTPVVAWTVAHRALALGIAISASHNPPAYNGIKPFARGGRKLEVEEEARVEAWMAEIGGGGVSKPRVPPSVPGAHAYVQDTVRFLDPGGRLDGLDLVVDLAAGAATTTAGAVLAALGARVRLLHPAGSRPINDECGTERPAAWREVVRATPGAVGLAFDGDADRVLLADEGGEILDGDDALTILALDLQARGGVPGGCVVSTVMANLGVEERLAEMGVSLERTAVGDKNVATRMRETGAVVGAEASGHVVLDRDGALIGDALVAGVGLLQAARHAGRTLASLRRETPRYPQLLQNVRVRERRPLEEVAAFRQALEAARARLGDRGRLVVRYSGTEPLLRVMAEGHDAEVVRAVVEGLVATAKETL